MPSPSFGENLKREREMREITLREIAEATKINLRYLDALEKNEFRHLPGGVFNKGFVRAYSQYIGIDAEAMVESYLEELKRQEARAQDREKERGRRSAGEPHRTATPNERPRSRTALWIALVAILLLAIAGGAGTFLLLRHRARRTPDPPSGAVATVPETGGSREAPPPAAPSGGAAEKPVAEKPASEAQTHATPPVEGVSVRIVVDRPVKGSVACDGRVVHTLESLPQGALLNVNCREALVLDADDAGALRVGVDGGTPVRLGEDGTPLVRHRIAALDRTQTGDKP
jgi:cytoskeleton protein RodZ